MSAVADVLRDMDLATLRQDLPEAVESLNGLLSRLKNGRATNLTVNAYHEISQAKSLLEGLLNNVRKGNHV